jgi:hypothetical protein
MFSAFSAMKALRRSSEPEIAEFTENCHAEARGENLF